MIYNDDSCSNCGGIRVAGSTLCADCLIKDNVRLKQAFQAMETATKASLSTWERIVFQRDREVEKLQHRVKLYRRIMQHVFRAYDELKEGRYNGKNGEAEDSGL